MKVEVGPVEPASAAAWIRWADETLIGPQSPTGVSLSPELVDDLRQYLEEWKSKARSKDDTFRWHDDIDPDQLEYLVHIFYSLDAQLSHDAQQGDAAPDQGRAFYIVLVRALLHALEMDSPGRAAFVDQLRSSWPIAAEGS